MGVVSGKRSCRNCFDGERSFLCDHTLFNPKSRLSCSVKAISLLGFELKGRDIRFANLEELPRHVEFQKGDTIVTSGYSSVFPQG